MVGCSHLASPRRVASPEHSDACIRMHARMHAGQPNQYRVTTFAQFSPLFDARSALSAYLNDPKVRGSVCEATRNAGFAARTRCVRSSR
jgi:hypothetical protein